MAFPIFAIIGITCLAATQAAPALRPTTSSNTSGNPEPCLVAGTKYLHGQQVPREDPCEFCLCLDGELFCWWQDCPSTAAEEGPCAESRDKDHSSCSGEWSTSATNSSGGVPDDQTTSPATSRAWTDLVAPNSSLEVRGTSPGPPTAPGCYVMGTEYKVGETLPRETGTCLECVCDKEARVTCSPKDCGGGAGQHDDFRPGNTLDMFDVDTF